MTVEKRNAELSWDGITGDIRNVHVTDRVVRLAAHDKMPGRSWICFGQDASPPAFWFGHLLACGFADHAELRRAVREIAQIDGETWAAVMAVALDQP